MLPYAYFRPAYAMGHFEWTERSWPSIWIRPWEGVVREKATIPCFISEPSLASFAFSGHCAKLETTNLWINCGTKHPLFLRHLNWANLIHLHISSSESPKIQGRRWVSYFGPALGWECRVMTSGGSFVFTEGTQGGKDFVFKIRRTWVWIQCCHY